MAGPVAVLLPVSVPMGVPVGVAAGGAVAVVGLSSRVRYQAPTPAPAPSTAVTASAASRDRLRPRWSGAGGRRGAGTATAVSGGWVVGGWGGGVTQETPAWVSAYAHSGGCGSPVCHGGRPLSWLGPCCGP
ncbi:hypothetical protein GCM10020256_28630 [Streptomyces thermocoprophilus]